MKTVNWGASYNKYNGAVLNPDVIESETEKLVMDDDVSNKSGIYPYILTRDEKYLNIRSFSPSMRQKAYEHQSGNCALCKDSFGISEMEADHITPWIEGGKTNWGNCQMLCRKCNRTKSDK